MYIFAVSWFYFTKKCKMPGYLWTVLQLRYASLDSTSGWTSNFLWTSVVWCWFHWHPHQNIQWLLVSCSWGRCDHSEWLCICSHSACWQQREGWLCNLWAPACVLGATSLEKGHLKLGEGVHAPHSVMFLRKVPAPASDSHFTELIQRCAPFSLHLQTTD